MVDSKFDTSQVMVDFNQMKSFGEHPLILERGKGIRVWDAFGKERFKAIEKALDAGLNRSIVVESADLVARRNGVSRYAVDFVQTDDRKGERIETKKLRAYLAVTAQPQTVQKSEQYENPAGFRVIDLALKERGNS